MVKVIEAPIKGLKIIELDIYKDDRGFFVERYNKKKFQELNLPIDYIQDNFSRSMPNVIRGLHYQNNPNQAKLVGCTSGKILDIAVDIRKNSSTFGKHFSIELSSDNAKLLYIPAGFAHGFCVIGNTSADVIYKVDALYSKEGEGGIAYNDPDLNINWPIKNPIISDKDQKLQSFKEYVNKS